MNDIVCNTRSLKTHLTGVQRYLGEILQHIGSQIDVVSSGDIPQGSPGHAWEQLVLPRKLHGRLLWSPTNSGPLAVRHQVVTVHDLVAFDHPEWIGWRYGQWYRFMWPRLLANVAHIIAISDYTRQCIQSAYGIPADRISVIPNGVDERFHPQDEQAIADARRECGVPTRQYVLSVSSIEPRKNLRRLIEAWRMVENRLPDDVSLLLAGKVGFKHVFPDAEITDLPKRVHFLGHVPDAHLPGLMSGARLFVYPSLYEGFGLPPLEAMACGTPVLTSNTSAIPEVVGSAAALIEPTDVEAIADAISTMLSDDAKCEVLRRAGLVQAQKYTWRKTSEETYRLLKRIAEDRS